MKKTRWIFLLSVGFMLGVFNKLSAQWTVVGSAGFSTGQADLVYVALDRNDTPYMYFRDVASGSKATVMKYNGSSWAAVGSAGISPHDAYGLSMAFDTSNTPYISYRDQSVSGKGSVLKYSGASWSNVGGVGFTPSVVTATDLLFDKNDSLFMAATDDGYGSKAVVRKWNGSSWNVIGSGAISVGYTPDVELVNDASNNIYLAYSDHGNSGKATVKTFNGSSWVDVGTGAISAGQADNVSFTIDSNDNLYVAYKDVANSNKATVYKYDGSTWATVGTAGFTSGTVEYTSIAIDTSGTPFLAFKDGGNSNKATVMKYNGSSWVTVGSAGFSTGTANNVSMAIDNTGSLYIGYKDLANGNKTTMMKYEFPSVWDGTSWSTGTPNSSTDVEIASNTAPTTFTCKDLSINSGFSLNTGTNNTVTIHGDITNNGNGVTGTGTLSFAKAGTSSVSGDTLEHEGTVLVSSGCTLQTNNKLRLKSNAANTGRIGNSAGTITGNVYAERYMPGKRCFRFYGHPFSSSIALSQLTDEIDITGNGGSANGFTTTLSNNPSAFYWDASLADNSTTGANPGWQAFTSATTATWDRYELIRLLVRGAKGEGLSGGSYTPTAATFEGVGVVNQGTQTVTLTKGTNSNFVSCGNPFPSGVQMSTVTKGSNIGPNYYVWDATSGVKGAYVTNAFTTSYVLPAYSALVTTATANSNNTLEFEEADKASGGAGLFKGTAAKNWVELYIYDSTTKWDRLLINLNPNGMAVEDKLDARKLYNPGLDFFTISQDDERLAIDVRPYADKKSIPLGLTAYNRYNKYVIRVGEFDIPQGTKLVLHDKYLNKQEELKGGVEYWFEVTADSNSQGRQRFEINMVGTPITSIAGTASSVSEMQLIPNPAYNEVKVSFRKLSGKAQLSITSVTGKICYQQEVNTSEGSVTIPLENVPAGMYIVELKGSNSRFTQKLIKQ